MQTYIGSKLINAKPMSRLEYNKFRGWELPKDENGDDPGYLIDAQYNNGGPKNTSAYSGYVSWSPVEVFKHEYRTTSEMTFGDAIIMLKAGHKIARKGWNGKGMFVYLVPTAKDPASRNELGTVVDHSDEFGLVNYSAYMVIKNVGGTVRKWVPNVIDCLAEDWTIVD